MFHDFPPFFEDGLAYSCISVVLSQTNPEAVHWPHQIRISKYENRNKLKIQMFQGLKQKAGVGQVLVI